MTWYVNDLFGTQYELDIAVCASRKRLLSSLVSVLMSKIDSTSPSSVKRKCIAFTSPIIWSILGFQVMRILFVFISYPCIFSEYFSLKINRLKINLYWCSFICYCLNMYMHVCVKNSLRKINFIIYPSELHLLPFITVYMFSFSIWDYLFRSVMLSVLRFDLLQDYFIILCNITSMCQYNIWMMYSIINIIDIFRCNIMFKP